MPSMAEKLWEMGKSPPQHMMFIVFGLVSILTALLVRSVAAFLLTTSAPALFFVAAVLAGIGAFFVTLALFLGAYAGSDNGSPGFKIAQLIGAVVVLIFLFI